MRAGVAYIIWVSVLCQGILNLRAQSPEPLFSPDGRIKVEVLLREKVYYRVSYDEEILLQASPVGITLNGKDALRNPIVQRQQRHAVRENRTALWGVRKNIPDHYNSLTLDFAGEISIEWRAFDQGVAYRIITRSSEKEWVVDHEEVAFRFNFQVDAWMLEGPSYESNYRKRALDVEAITDFRNAMRKIFLPMVVQATPKIKVAITEAGVYNYPSLFLDRGNDYENFLNGTFEKYALRTQAAGFSNYAQVAATEATYIARIAGKTELPWRLLIIAPEDAVLADCDLVYLLSRPAPNQDFSWVKPGKVAWDWWHDYVVTGQDFKGGINTPTYLHYIDFAAKNGLEYIMVDWLWTDKYDLTLFNPEVDIRKIITYGREKSVGVLLWCPGHTLFNQLDKALDLFASIGAAGVKVDFFGREDQTGMAMYEAIAAAAAKRRLVVDFHGCTKPTGLSRTYPNVLNYEAVLGNEYNKLEDKCTVDHKVMLAFTRALQGPMDFTPGGMRNGHADHAIFFTKPMVHGTRSNEMALYVLYHEPLKMLCDAPSAYELEPAVLEFIRRIPVSWDESKVRSAVLGEYLVVARQKDDEWYVAGITNGQPRDVALDLSFLGSGRYLAEIMKDGVNAGRIATDHTIEQMTLDPAQTFHVAMAGGGGFLMHLKALTDEK